MRSIFSPNNKIKTYIEYFFIIFILLQPFLDVMAFMGLSVSLLIRVIAMFVGFIYILVYPNKKYKKILLGYIIILGIFMLIHIINNFIIKEPFYMYEELKYTIKTIFVVFMLLIYTLVFLSFRDNHDGLKNVQKSIFISISFIGVVMFVADFTGTGKRSYGHLMKEGHSGWFYSGNELSAILAMGFAIMILYFISIKNIKVKFALFPLILLASWASLQIGTKVGLGAVLSVIVISLFISLIALFFNRLYRTNFVLLILLFVGIIIYLPYSPIGHNMNFTLLSINENDSNIDNDSSSMIGEEQPNVELDENEEVDLKDKRMENIVKNKWVSSLLSGRQNFFVNTLNQYQDAPLSQKLFGMGVGGNYEGNLKLIEMDYLDWFFGYGIIGFTLLFGTLIFYGISIINFLVIERFKQINTEYILVAISVGLGLGVSLIAGHVLLNPASGIYLSIMLSYLYVLSSHTRQ